MKPSVIGIAAALLLLTPGVVAAGPPSDRQAAVDFRSDLENMLRWGEKMIDEHYMPTSKVGRPFAQRCQETKKNLRDAPSISEAYALISDAFCSVDPRIRFYPPARALRIDYSWNWSLIGNAAYVDQLDRQGSARDQGLQLGDRVLAMEGTPVTRETYQQLYYLFTDLAPPPGLRVLAQSPSGEPRLLGIEATIREKQRWRQRGRFWLERERSATGQKSYDEFWDPARHVRRVGDTGYWNAEELNRDALAVGQALKLLDGIKTLVIDLRGQYIRQHEPVIRALESLFSHDLPLGRIDRDGPDITLRVNGRKDALPGIVLVLTDAETAGYAELLAHVVQHEQRGIIVGDRTMGRVFEEKTVGQVNQGNVNGFYIAKLTVPAGEVVLTDGTTLDGRGVIPDFQVLPQPADLAAHRDVVLSKAFAQLKQSITPEEAYGFRPHYADDDDEY